MAVTVAAFREEFEEYATRPSDAKIQAKLDEAALCTPEDVWGDYRDAGIKYLAAHLLAIAPGGKDMRKGAGNGESMYRPRRKELERIVASGYRTAGLPPPTAPEE